VVSALTALPDLQQLTWREMGWGQEGKLSDSRLLQQLTRLTSLELQCVAAEALQHLSSLTKLQHLRTQSLSKCPVVDYPGLRELQGLTSLVLQGLSDIMWFRIRQKLPACVSQLTALQQLEVTTATATELSALTALTALTKLVVAQFDPIQLSPGSTPSWLPALEHLNLGGSVYCPALHASYLASCTQLRQLSLSSFSLTGPGSLVASSMLQELYLRECNISSCQGRPADMSRWELLFPGPGRLPHLTSLVLQRMQLHLNLADMHRLVGCCSSLRELQLEFNYNVQETSIEMTALLPLPHLTKLQLCSVADWQCSSLAQLTGLQELCVRYPSLLSTMGLRHLARLEQLTSLGFVFGFANDEVSGTLRTHLSDTLARCKHALVNKVRMICQPLQCCGCMPVDGIVLALAGCTADCFRLFAHAADSHWLCLRRAPLVRLCGS